jgi:hypothetical protein
MPFENMVTGVEKFLTDRLREVPRNIRASIPKQVDYFDPAKGARIVSSAKPLMNPNLAGVAAASSMFGNLAGRVATPFAVYSQAQEVFKPKDNIITALQNLGTSIENRSAAPGQERRYVGSNPLAVRANRALDSAQNTGMYGRYIPGSKQVPINQTSQNTGMYGRYIPGSKQVPINQTRDLPPNMGGGTGFGTTQDLGAGTVPIVLGTRDGVTADPTQSDQYKAELSRYMNTVAGPSKEQLGLQMWAQANPGLAAKLKPGQSGYDQSVDYFNNRYRDYGDMPSTGAIGTSPLNQMPLEGQQPVQMAQPEMEGVAPESTNERVQNFLRMLTEVGQGQ